MDATIIIPTRRRPAKLRACIERLAAQTHDRTRFEVLIGVDGRDSGESHAIAQIAHGHLRAVVHEVADDSDRPVGQATVRNRLIELARGRLLIFLNDDMLPEPSFVAAHTGAHAATARPSIIVGDSPWVVHSPDRVIDRLIRETSMIFFYDRMHARTPADPDHDWGFRHAWMLNLSIPTELVRSAGGVTVFPCTYGYEDDELAFRLAERAGMPVLFRPLATAWHDHRYSPADYLSREYRLGYAALGFARTSPRCAVAMFGRDITGPAELDYCRAFVEREAALAQRLRESFETTCLLPAETADARLVRPLYEQHLLLKRWQWRRGLIAASAGRPMEE